MNEVESEIHGGTSVHKLNCFEEHSNKFARMPNSRVKQLLVFRLLDFVVMVLNAHSQALFVAADPTTKYPVLVYFGVYVHILFCRFHSCCMHVFNQEELGQQLALFARKGRAFCIYLFLSLVADLLGLLLTCLLAHRERFNMYEYISNLLPAGFSILNTLINACM